MNLAHATTIGASIGKDGAAILAAAFVGALALIAPAAALLLLAVLGARVLMRAEAAPRIDLQSLAGPAFAALIAGLLVGLAAAIGVLFVWRLWSDARWSAQEAARRADLAGQPGQNRFSQQIHIWATPIYGLAAVAYTAPHMVAGLPLDLPHIPGWSIAVIAIGAGLAVADWLLRRAADWRLGELASAPFAHLAAHHAVFVLAFGLMIDVSAGLCALIAWRLAHAAPLQAPRAA